jgi:hypothetical protein
MDPQKNVTDEFQQLQSIGSMGKSNNCLKIAMLSEWALPDQTG